MEVPDYLNVFRALRAWYDGVFRTDRMAAWIAFGEILGFYRQVDDTAREHEWSLKLSQTPEAEEEQAPSRVEEALEDAQARLAECEKHSKDPAHIVVSLSPVIETLVRRMWPEESGGSGKRADAISGILHVRLRSDDLSDRTFASLALTLYKCFRNPSLHDFERFRCSIEEANCFLWGVKTLLLYTKRQRQ